MSTEESALDKIQEAYFRGDRGSAGQNGSGDSSPADFVPKEVYGKDVIFPEPTPAIGSIIPPSQPPITDATYRPWTFEEVPMGAEICWADSSTRVRVSEIIVGRRLWIGDVLTITAGRNDYPATFLLDSGHLCSINSGPWRRCGVEIPTTPPCQSP